MFDGTTGTYALCYFQFSTYFQVISFSIYYCFIITFFLMITLSSSIFAFTQNIIRKHISLPWYIRCSSNAPKCMMLVSLSSRLNTSLLAQIELKCVKRKKKRHVHISSCFWIVQKQLVNAMQWWIRYFVIDRITTQKEIDDDDDTKQKKNRRWRWSDKNKMRHQALMENVIFLFSVTISASCTFW